MRKTAFSDVKTRAVKKKTPYYPAFSHYYPVNQGKKGKRGPQRARIGYPHPG